MGQTGTTSSQCASDRFGNLLIYNSKEELPPLYYSNTSSPTSTLFYFCYNYSKQELLLGSHQDHRGVGGNCTYSWKKQQLKNFFES